MEQLLSYRYISQKGADKLKEYKYSGEDRSYLYIHVLTPMNKFLVQFIPTNIAPNTITLTGLACTVTSHLLTFAYSPNFSTPLPPWLCFFAGFILFAYQTIDNLDGRQARRTNSSSPLGLLFDHGVDAINVSISTMVMMAILQLDTTPKLFYLWTTVFAPFVFATWEEYYTDKLVLAEVNGPTDGVFLCMVFCFIAGISPHFWTNTFAANFPLLAYTPIGKLQTHWFVIGGGWLAVAATAAGNMREVSKRKSLLNGPLITLAPFAALWVSSLLWILYSPSHLFTRHPRLFLLSSGFLFCNLVCKLMLAHTTAQHYKPLRLVLIPLLTTVAFILVVRPAGWVEDVALYGLLASHFLYWLHFVVVVIGEITEILGIYAFDITNKRPRRKEVGSAGVGETARNGGRAELR